MWPFRSPKAPAGADSHPTPSPATDDNQRDRDPNASTSNIPSVIRTRHHDRLGMMFPMRLPFVTGAAFIGGLMMGGAKGGYIAADRYRAENAHRLPISRSGWYLYHKSKNYHTTIGSLKEGVKQGAILMGWAALFATAEEMIDRARGRLFVSYVDEADDDAPHRQRDMMSTAMAGLTVSGVYSWKQGFDAHSAARMAKVSLKYSLAYGLLQDVLATLQGDRPGYIRWVMRQSSTDSLLQDCV